MGWETKKTKAPLEYDEEDAKKKPDKELRKSEQDRLTREIVSGVSEKEEPIAKKPIVTVFDSSKDNR